MVSFACNNPALKDRAKFSVPLRGRNAPGFLCSLRKHEPRFFIDSKKSMRTSADNRRNTRQGLGRTALNHERRRHSIRRNVTIQGNFNFGSISNPSSLRIRHTNDTSKRKSGSKAARKVLNLWWPGTESNRRHADFQFAPRKHAATIPNNNAREIQDIREKCFPRTRFFVDLCSPLSTPMCDRVCDLKALHWSSDKIDRGGVVWQERSRTSLSERVRSMRG